MANNKSEIIGYLAGAGWNVLDHGGQLIYTSPSGQWRVEFFLIVVDTWELSRFEAGRYVEVDDGYTLQELWAALIRRVVINEHPGCVAAMQRAEAFQARLAAGTQQFACHVCGQDPCESPNNCAMQARMEAQ